MKTSTKHQQSLMMAYSVNRLSTADLITHHKGIQLALTNLSQVNTHTPDTPDSLKLDIIKFAK